MLIYKTVFGELCGTCVKTEDYVYPTDQKIRRTGKAFVALKKSYLGTYRIIKLLCYPE